MNNSREHIARRIKSLRKQKDLTQAQLSSLCNYSRTYIGKIERGEKSPSLETLIRLADALNTDLVNLFCDQSDNNTDTGKTGRKSKTPSVFRQFNYIVGTMDPEGSLVRVRMIPWSYEKEKITAHGKKLWELDIIKSIEHVENEIREGIRNASLGESSYYHLKDTSSDTTDHICDLAIHPLSEKNGKVIELGFEYFWPSRFKSNGQLDLTDTLFNRIEKITDEEDKLKNSQRMRMSG